MGFDDECYAEHPENRKEYHARFKWERIRKPKIPAIHFKEVDYTPKPGKRLTERFAASGLQIIVKMVSIELTPEKSEFPVGVWHVEGRMNECICAAALYYLDSDNIRDPSLSFRMRTSRDLEEVFDVREGSYHWLQQIYGTYLHGELGCCLQNYGSIQMRQERLLAFPNVFQHCVSSFKLIDPTKPGHRRCIALWLVEPTQRIISTANVPPQQMSWYAEELLSSDTSARKDTLDRLPPDVIELLAQVGVADVTTDRDCRLPQELRDFVWDYVKEDKDVFPMSVEEANEHRIKLMKERSAFVELADEQQEYVAYHLD